MTHGTQLQMMTVRGLFLTRILLIACLVGTSSKAVFHILLNSMCKCTASRNFDLEVTEYELYYIRMFKQNTISVNYRKAFRSAIRTEKINVRS